MGVGNRMFKIGGRFIFSKSSDGKKYFEQERLNILHIRLSIPLKTIMDKNPVKGDGSE